MSSYLVPLERGPVENDELTLFSLDAGIKGKLLLPLNGETPEEALISIGASLESHYDAQIAEVLSEWVSNTFGMSLTDSEKTLLINVVERIRNRRWIRSQS